MTKVWGYVSLILAIAGVGWAAHTVWSGETNKRDLQHRDYTHKITQQQELLVKTQESLAEQQVAVKGVVEYNARQVELEERRIANQARFERCISAGVDRATCEGIVQR